MDSLSKTAYADAFGYDRPERVGRLLSGRLQAAKDVNERLADYFSERAEIEEVYAQSLQRAVSKLQGRPFSNPSLGRQSTKALERATSMETLELVRLHERFAKKCRDELEVPLRNRVRRDDWTLVEKQERNNTGLLRDIEEGQRQLQKTQGKSSKKDRVSTLMSSLADSESAYSATLPNQLTSYQQLDYARLTSIKELITSFETLQNDLGRERMELAERGLENILSWEVELELSEWLSREGFKGGRVVPAGNTASTPSIEVNTPAFEPPTQSAIPETGGRARTGTLDNQSIRSGNNNLGRAPSIASTDAGKSEKKKKGFLSALKVGRLDRRKSIMQNSPTDASQRQAGNPISNEGYGSAQRDPLRSSQASTAREGSSDRYLDADRDGTLRPTPTARRSNRDSFLPSFSSLGAKKRNPIGNDGYSKSQDDRTRAGSAFNVDEFGARSATGIQEDSIQGGSNPTISNSTSRSPFNAGTGNNGSSVQQVSMFGDYGNDTIPTRQTTQNGALVDEQGYSVPPNDYNKPTWASERGGGRGAANLMDDEDSDDDDVPSSNMRVSIAPISTSHALPSRENDEEAQAALMRMKGTLLSQGPASASGSSVNRRATRIGGRNSRQSTAGTSALSTESPASGPIASNAVPVDSPVKDSPREELPVGTILEMHKQQNNPIKNSETVASPVESLVSPPLSPTTAFIGQNARAGSVLSTSSSQQNSAHTVVNPFAAASPADTAAGPLKASILETVNVLFKGGDIIRVLITGEISLYSKNFDFASISDPANLRIRIEDFEKFEKFAPNNSILTPVSNGPKEGEYSLNVSALQSAKDGINTIFKYQFRVEGGLRSYVPVEINPQWKLDPDQKQVSFIMSYHGNSGCSFTNKDLQSPFGPDETSADGNAVLQDVYFNVPIPSNLKGSSVSNIQTKPTGSYSAEKKRIIWKMDNLDVGHERTAKILARFNSSDLVDGNSHEIQPVVIHWRLPGVLASGINIQLLGGDGRDFDEIIKQTISGKYLASP